MMYRYRAKAANPRSYGSATQHCIRRTTAEIGLYACEESSNRSTLPIVVTTHNRDQEV